MTGDWPTAARWLAGASDDPRALVVAGVPLAAHAVTPSRYDLAPAAVRARLGRLSTWHGGRAVELAEVPVRDVGDGDRPPPLDAPLTVLLGGHNAVTYHALAGAGGDLARWGLLTLDAHHDVRPYAAGAVGNGSPVRALVDAGLPAAHVVQVGITGFSNAGAHRRWCEERGVTVLGPDRLGQVPALLDALAGRCDHVYVDVDLDVLDRAFAPGCPGSRPGGAAPAQVFDAALAAGAHPAVRAVDVVELDPTADVASVTADAAALTLLNVAAGYALRRRP
ncbi:MAG TPA: arginase family protein [Acidimicrobiales bacterium]|nr:arginase family protein [Acidimicrobiales bacterium]